METNKVVMIPVETVGQAYLEILRAWSKGCRYDKLVFTFRRDWQ